MYSLVQLFFLPSTLFVVVLPFVAVLFSGKNPTIGVVSDGQVLECD